MIKVIQTGTTEFKVQQDEWNKSSRGIQYQI